MALVSLFGFEYMLRDTVASVSILEKSLIILYSELKLNALNLSYLAE